MNFKSFFYVLISLILNSAGVYAATQINTPTVSGTWSIQGSPYYIHNNITIPFDSMLRSLSPV